MTKGMTMGRVREPIGPVFRPVAFGAGICRVAPGVVACGDVLT